MSAIMTIRSDHIIRRKWLTHLHCDHSRPDIDRSLSTDERMPTLINARDESIFNSLSPLVPLLPDSLRHHFILLWNPYH